MKGTLSLQQVVCSGREYHFLLFKDDQAIRLVILPQNNFEQMIIREYKDEFGKADVLGGGILRRSEGTINFWGKSKSYGPVHEPKYLLEGYLNLARQEDVKGFKVRIVSKTTDKIMLGNINGPDYQQYTELTYPSPK